MRIVDCGLRIVDLSLLALAQRNGEAKRHAPKSMAALPSNDHSAFCNPISAMPSVLLWLLVAIASPLPAADFPSALVRSHPQLGTPFLQQAESAMRSVPENVWAGIRQAGWRVHLAEFVVDAAPQLRNTRPRGWPTNFTWSQTDAVNLPDTRVLILAEKRRRRSGEVVTSDRVSGVFRHELGHAFDMIADRRYAFRSSNPQFIRAYQNDVAQFGEDQDRELAYYLQGCSAGRQEAFAEAFAILLGGGSDVTKATQFEQAFPRVLEYLRAEIDHYEP
jgi:hypothetical protein